MGELAFVPLLPLPAPGMVTLDVRDTYCRVGGQLDRVSFKGSSCLRTVQFNYVAVLLGYALPETLRRRQCLCFTRTFLKQASLVDKS